MRFLALLLLVLAVVTPASAGPGPLLPWREEKADTPPEPEDPEIPEDLPPAVAEQTRKILGRRYWVTFTVARFDDLPKGLESLLARDDPVLTAADSGALSEATRSGKLGIERIAAVSGGVGGCLRARSGGHRREAMRRYPDSAQSAVILYPRTHALRSGLTADVRLRITAGRGVRVEYDLVLSDEPVLETIEDLGGPIDHVEIPEIHARGALRLAPGEVAPMLFERADGSGTLVLMRLDGPDHPLPAVAHLGEDLFVVAVGHLRNGPARAPFWESGPPDLGEDDEKDEGTGFVDTGWDELLSLVDYGRDCWDLPEGLRAVRVDDEARDLLRERLEAGARLRGQRGGLEVRRPGWGRARLPLGPGEPFSLFRGTRRTERGRTEVQSGCHDASGALATREATQTGLAASGRVFVDGSVDYEVIGREILEVENRELALFRVAAGHRKIERVPMRLPLVHDALLRVRATLANRSGDLPGGVRMEWTGPHGPPVGEPPLALTIGGHALHVRSGRSGRLVLAERRARVLDWRSDGWCGMRIRHPRSSARPGWVDRESDAILQPQLDGLRLAFLLYDEDGAQFLDLTGEVGAPPDAAIPFDPGDGAIEIVRHRRLAIEIDDLPIAGGGVVARGAGLRLDVLRPGIEPGFGPHVHVVVRRPEGVTELRTGDEGSLRAGGRVLLPKAFTTYESNHGLGEVTTYCVPAEDGVRLDVRDFVGPKSIALTILSPLVWHPHDLRTSQAPARSGDRLRTLGVEQRTRRRTFMLEEGGRLRARSPAGAPLPYVLEAGGDS